MTDAEWALIALYVEPDPPIGSPRDMCMRCVVNALFYWVKTGCQWKMLPTNFPNYSTVYHHFRRWSNDGTLERIAHALQRQVRRAAGRNPDPGRGIVGSQSAPTAEAGGDRDFDSTKHVNGRKRFIITDTLSLLLTVVIMQAAVSDTASAALLGDRLGPARRLRHLVVDQGFKAAFHAWRQTGRGIQVETVKRRPGAFNCCPFGGLSSERLAG